MRGGRVPPFVANLRKIFSWLADSMVGTLWAASRFSRSSCLTSALALFSSLSSSICRSTALRFASTGIVSAEAGVAVPRIFDIMLPRTSSALLLSPSCSCSCSCSCSLSEEDRGLEGCESSSLWYLVSCDGCFGFFLELMPFMRSGLRPRPTRRGHAASTQSRLYRCLLGSFYSSSSRQSRGTR